MAIAVVAAVRDFFGRIALDDLYFSLIWVRLVGFSGHSRLFDWWPREGFQVDLGENVVVAVVEVGCAEVDR